MRNNVIILMLVLLLVMSPCAVYASGAAGTLTVAGSIASGGLSGAFSSTTERNAIVITMLLMQSLGMTVHLAESAKNAGITAYEFVKTQFAKWVGGTEAESLSEDQKEELKKRFSVIEGGGGQNNSVGPDGKIYIAAGALLLIRQFFKYLQDEGIIHELANIGNPDIVNDTYYGDGINVVKDGTTYNLYTRYYNHGYINIPSAWICMQVEGGYSICAYNTMDYRSNFELKGSYTGSSASGVNGFARAINSGVFDSVTNQNVLDISTLGFSNFDAYLRSLTAGEMQEGSSGGDGSEDTFISGDFNSSDLNNPNDGYAVIDPKLIADLLNNVPAGDSYSVRTEDYMKALQEMLNKQANTDYQPDPENVPAQNNANLQPENLPYPDALPENMPLSLPATETVPGENNPPGGSSPIVGTEPAPPDVSVPMMMFRLEDYFPFCIPFDVVALMQKFYAEPQAPSWDIGFYEPFSQTDVVLHCDLSVFDNLMVIVRNVELIAFTMGLMIKTKDIFARG